MVSNRAISNGMSIRMDAILEGLPLMPPFAEGIRRAPKRRPVLSRSDTVLALRNALRYVPEEWHKTLAPEFLDELLTRGRIYAYRFRPEGRIRGNPIESYRGNCVEGKAFQVMIDNNLDFDVALYPYELVTYGETGQVCQNWMQYRLITALPPEADRRIRRSSSSPAIPLGLFRSGPRSPTGDHHQRPHGRRVRRPGKLAAGGCPWRVELRPDDGRGLDVHRARRASSTAPINTLLNAARQLRRSASGDADMAGCLFVSSGLGGMSGAQGKAVRDRRRRRHYRRGGLRRG